MAKLVGVAKKVNHAYSNRQMPLLIEDSLTMVLQFPDTCLNCEFGQTNKTELERFIRRYTTLNIDEINTGLSATQQDVIDQLSSLIPCVGCRKSVERMLGHLVTTQSATLDPLMLKNGRGENYVTLGTPFKKDTQQLYSLLYIHGDKLHEYLASVLKVKKNRRCILHSLETQKNKPNGAQLMLFHTNWLDLWALISEDCKKALLTVEYQRFMDAMLIYLEKHRFCIECKAKVLHAHGLMIGDNCRKKDKGFCPGLYDGIEYCKDAKHVHVRNDIELIGSLIARAEPDLVGSRRERHAKTMDIAQEEVLTCLGSFLYVRFNRLLQKLKLEEQTWKQLFYVSISCLRKNYELQLEKKQGVSQLELLCAEIQLEEETKEQKREKRKKKKKPKQKRSLSSDLACGPEVHQASSIHRSGCQCTVNPLVVCEMCRREQEAGSEAESEAGSVSSSSRSPSHSGVQEPGEVARELGGVCDLGYSSGPEACDSCSVASSSINEIESLAELPVETDSNIPCECSNQDPDYPKSTSQSSPPNHPSGSASTNDHDRNVAPFLTLQDMLDDSSGDREDSDTFISEEDIAAFRSNPAMHQQREQLRQHLKHQFDLRMNHHE